MLDLKASSVFFSWGNLSLSENRRNPFEPNLGNSISGNCYETFPCSKKSFYIPSSSAVAVKPANNLAKLPGT